MPVRANWATQQLVGFLARVASAADEEEAIVRAVERAAEALDATFAAVVCDGVVSAAIGFPAGRVPAEALAAVTVGSRREVDVPGVGPVAVSAVPLGDEEPGWLLIGRHGSDSLAAEELALARGIARVLALTMGTLRGMVALRQRHLLLERISAIQRAITRRAPLPEVLEAIADAARELLGDDVAVLRLIDGDDPGTMLTAATSGVPDDVVGQIDRRPIGEGAGGRAIAEERLVIVEDYSAAAAALPAFADLQLQAAIAAPVHERGVVIGSLTVASYKQGRQYTAAEQQMLMAFAEHASLALMDAKTVEVMVHQALHDSLTGLPNRRLFLDRLEHALQRRVDRDSIAVIFLDVDRFKTVNDTLGHVAGDRLLVELAERLRGCIRPSDTIARLGGDEFAMLVEELDSSHDAARLADRMCAAVREPVTLEQREVLVTASAGIALAHGGDPLRDADTAMYRAKASGGDSYEFFEPSMRKTAVARLVMEAELQRGIQRNELLLHYQPIVELRTREIVAVEALVRWQHPRLGLLGPAAFIPMAEDTGAIVEIGRWVLRESCRQLADWEARIGMPRPLTISVNLSGRQLQQARLADEVMLILERGGIDADRLILEVTETTLMGDTTEAHETLAKLKEAGVRLALDDFGTGYSSLRSLRSLPLDILKIPQTFVDGVEHGFENAALARASVQLADTFALDVIAEGVERHEQLVAIEQLGCQYAQGYLLGRPQVPDQLEQRLTRDGALQQQQFLEIEDAVQGNTRLCAATGNGTEKSLSKIPHTRQLR